MSLNIPEFMPILSRGGHDSPASGACIMEYASFLAGEEWTDYPKCTNEMLARAAQYINDDLADGERQALLPLLPRLMGTSDHSGAVNHAVAKAAANYVQPLIGHKNQYVDMDAREAQINLQRKDRYVILQAQAAVASADWDQIAFLSALIDAYDEATGRTAPATVTEDDLRRCAELTGAKA